MKRYELKIIVELNDDTDFIMLTEDQTLDDLGLNARLQPGESIISLEVEEVPIPELPT